MGKIFLYVMFNSLHNISVIWTSIKFCSTNSLCPSTPQVTVSTLKSFMAFLHLSLKVRAIWQRNSQTTETLLYILFSTLEIIYYTFFCLEGRYQKFPFVNFSSHEVFAWIIFLETTHLVRHVKLFWPCMYVFTIELLWFQRFIQDFCICQHRKTEQSNDFILFILFLYI